MLELPDHDSERTYKMMAHAATLAQTLVRRMARSVLYCDDKLFDLRMGIRTTKRESIGKYLSSHKILEGEPTAHSEATRVMTLRIAFRELSKPKYQPLPKVFADIGCGMGRVCFYASSMGWFDEIEGIDLSDRLIDGAMRNLQRSGQSGIRFSVGNAVDVRFHDAPIVVFFFNPFGESVMRAFIVNNSLALHRPGSIIIYVNDIFADTLKDLGFEQAWRNNGRRVSIWRFNDRDHID